MARTSLSDHISAMYHATTPVAQPAMIELFLCSQVGFEMTGFSGKHGDVISSTAAQPFTVKMVSDPGGRPMIKACADPALFSVNYKADITATMTGHEALAMLLKMPEVAGVLVCSAASFHSWAIYRADAMQMLRKGPDAPRRPWWKVWG